MLKLIQINYKFMRIDFEQFFNPFLSEASPFDA